MTIQLTRRRWSILLALLAVTLFISGCTSINIEGTWRSGGIDSGSYWEFRPDGKMQVTSGLIVMKGRYTLKGHKLSTDQDRQIVYDVTLREDELTLKNDGDSIVLYRVKE
ncbi:MAG: DUF5640 domain-containing protein [Armatimonadota bacterium]